MPTVRQNRQNNSEAGLNLHPLTTGRNLKSLVIDTITNQGSIPMG
jgi:hypothetical protein